MRDRLIKFLATGFGVGYCPQAPGTVGSLVGVGYWWVLAHGNGYVYWTTTLAGLAWAVLISGGAAKLFGEPDPSKVVIDEIAVMPVALAGLTEFGWPVVVGFLLFRLFDVWKPGPIREVQHLPGGWGIVADDLLAALTTLTLTAGTMWVWEMFSR